MGKISGVLCVGVRIPHYRTPEGIYKISWGDGEMGRWGDDEARGYFYTFFPILFLEILTPVRAIRESPLRLRASCILYPVS